MSHKPVTARTPEMFAATLNVHEQSGYHVISSGCGDGTWWAVLYREEDWSYPFRLACTSDSQYDLVQALTSALECAVDHALTDPERVKRIRDLIAPMMPKKPAVKELEKTGTALNLNGHGDAAQGLPGVQAAIPVKT